MAIVDRHGLPLSICTKNLISDRVCYSHPLAEESRKCGIEMIAPHVPTEPSRPHRIHSFRVGGWLKLYLNKN